MSVIFVRGIRAARRFTGFALNTVALALASLLLVPATIGAAGLETWSSIVLAQAVAQVAATVVGWGYGVNGPAVIATLSRDEGIEYFRAAERTRLLVAIPCFALMICVLALVPNPDPIAGLLGGAPVALGAFSASFFYIGRSAPKWYLFAETLPRVTLMLAGALGLVMGLPLLVGLALPVAGVGLAVLASNVSIRFTATRLVRDGKAPKVTDVRTELREQRRPMASFLLSNGGAALPVFVVAAVAPDLVGTFGVFDRVQRQSAVALSPITATLQGWVPRRMALQGSARPAAVAMFAGLLTAIPIILLFATFGPLLIAIISAHELSPSPTEGLLCGAVIATSMLINLIAYACLVPLGSMSSVIYGNVVGIGATFLAIPLMMLGGHSVVYALGALVIGNVVQVALQLILLKRRVGRAALVEV